jgi:phosphatidylserine decarboxylase
MMKSNLFIIAKKGWGYLLYSVGAFLIFTFLDCDFLAFLAFLITLFFLFVFRNPERELMEYEKKSILSPVDGVISAITELSDDSEYAYRVDITSSYLDVSILRVPLNAKVESVAFQNGTRVSQKSGLFQDTNENVEIVFVDDDANKIKVSHRLTQSFAPLSIEIISSQTLHKSSRYGLMLSGLTSIYLPSNIRLSVNVANETQASQTLLGYLS